MSIFRLIVISGIFSRKEEDLDILPPPPPFPEIGEEIKKTEKTEKQKAKEEKKKQLEEEKRKAQEEKAEQEERARKEKERQEQQKIKENKRKQRKESAFKFFNKLGLVKTEEQKKEAERRRKEESRKKEEEEKRKEAEKARLEREKKKEEEKRQREAEKKRLAEEKKRKLEEKRKQEEIQRKKLQKADEERKKALKQKTFDFWNKVGLAMTEEEIDKHRKHKEDHKKAKLESGKRLEEHEKRLEGEKRKKELAEERLRQKEERKRIAEEKKAQKEIEGQRKLQEKTGKFEPMRMPELTKFEQPIPKEKTFFGNIFKKETRLDKELEELEKSIALEKEEREEKSSIASQKIKGTREEDYGNEIQRAIEGIKKEKKPSPMFSGFFRRKLEVGLPGIMPRTIERHDPLHSIEAKLHKARLALMDLRLEDAKRIYIEIMEIYNGLDAGDKAKVYQDIKDLYYERKGAERYAK